jgi:hypothetical protein
MSQISRRTVLVSLSSNCVRQQGRIWAQSQLIDNKGHRGSSINIYSRHDECAGVMVIVFDKF